MISPYDVTRLTVHEYMRKGTTFKTDTLLEDIIMRGGLLRVDPEEDVFEYLDYLRSVDKVTYDPIQDTYQGLHQGKLYVIS